MIRENNRTGKKVTRTRTPRPDTIAQECSRIRAQKLIENSERYRVDAEQRRYQAHLRFIQFLIETSTK